MGLLYSKKQSQFENKSLKIVLLGLENAGKTSFMHYLQRKDTPGETIPTVGFNIGETFLFEKKGLVFDIGGKNCSMWKHYVKDTNVVIFLVDCSDQTRRPNLQEQLLDLAHNIDSDTQVVFLLNKVDLATEYFIKDFIEEFKIDHLFDNDMFFDRISVTQNIGMEALAKKLTGFLKFSKLVL